MILVIVVTFALEDFNSVVVFELVHKPVSVINATAPAIVVTQRLRLSSPLVSVSSDILEQ